MIERRVPERTRTFLRGRIEFNGGQASLECLVRDLSEEGARLSVPESVTLPDSFRLVIPKNGRSGVVVTRWRRGDQIGVHFAAADVPRATTDPLVQEAHVRELENEVARLRRILEELRADPGRLQILLDKAV